MYEYDGRGILFRGISLETKEWVYGDVFQTNKSDPLRHRYKSIFIHCHTTGSIIQVDPITIGQFTGVFDKNFVKIFEKDIIADPEAIYYDGLVFYSNGAFGVLLCRMAFLSLSSFVQKDLEVIGSQYKEGL